MKLNYSELNAAYLNWSAENGDGRNKEDLRFGQYLWSKYNNMSNFTDVFYIESCEKIYSILLNDLHKLEIK